MEELCQGRVRKIVSPFQFILEDCKDGSAIKIQVKPVNNKSYSHLLPVLFKEKVEYELQKRKSIKIREQYSKGTIFLEGKELTSFYREKQEKVYMGSEIDAVKKLVCFVSKVECLKLELINLADLKFLTFYFSELKLIRVGNIHPKEMWQRSQSYFKHQMEGQFIELAVGGSQNYKEQVNIFGDIVRLRDKENIRQRTIKDGYAELSKDAQKYLSEQQIKHYNALRSKAKESTIGFWQASKNISKSNMQALEFKYRQWEQWIKENKSLSKVRNEEEQFKNILQELNKISRISGKLQHNKIKIIMDVLICLFQDQFSKKNLKFLQQVVKSICLTFNNLQIPFYQQTDNLDYIKSVNKMLVFLIFYHEQLQKLIEFSKGQKIAKNSGMDFEKCIKFIFKLCFLGNQTFHDKLFGKKKENNYENFNFEHVYLEGGFSSLSECSDYEEADKLSREEKKQRKLHSAHQKIRINSTSVLSFLFKHYPNIVQNYWQMCVTSNVLTKDFLSHITKLRITTSQIKMNTDEKKEIVNFMRSNFGEHSLILLTFFEKNIRVKSNSITCLLNMISNFQGKKLIATTESVYIQKLLKQTKSSFVPKSFIIFSGLRNTLYFLLFVLYYQKNLQIIILIFKTLCELCNNCTLIDKMSFQQGMGLLLRNYIVPVLQFEWTITQLQELKILIINFLSVLMSSTRKWQEIELTYLKSKSENINLMLMRVMSQRRQTHKNVEEDKMVCQIMNYFTRLCKNYYSVLFHQINEEEPSIWNFLKSVFSNVINASYNQFVEQVFKSYLDEVQIISSSNSRKIEPSIQNSELSAFLVNFLKVYSCQISISNYLHLLSTITYVDYDEWSKPQFCYAKNFLLHCFYSFVEEDYSSKQYESIEVLKTNSYIRIALMKLVGYMSFCAEFQTEQVTKKSINCLLKLSKQYKSLNSLVKISWGLSNWAKVASFSLLSQKQLRECLDYMVANSGSDKQKIASNCTRGIGFFVGNVGKKFNLKDCRKHIIKNLSHSVLKVRTNSTKTLLSVAEDLTEEEIKQLLPLLEQNILKNNYHLQMESLHLLKKIGNPIQGKRLLGLFVSILKNMMNYTTLEYVLSEMKTIRQLRFAVLSEIFGISSEIKNYPEFSKDIVASICQFLGNDCKDKNNLQEKDSKITEKQFEKSEEAQKLIFGKKEMERFNDQKIIETQLKSKGLAYKAEPEQLSLILKIKQFCQNTKESLSQDWSKLSGVRVEGNTILIDFAALQIFDPNEDYEYIVME